LPGFIGSHQQVAPPDGQLAALRHLSTRCSAAGRFGRLTIELTVPGLAAVSMGSAEGSMVPGRACAISCHSSLCDDSPDAMICDVGRGGLRITPWIFPHGGAWGRGGARGG